MTYWVDIEVENTTSTASTVTVPKGRILLPKNLGKSQALVVTSNVKVTIPPHAKKKFKVPTACIDPPLPPPQVVPMDFTVFGQQQAHSAKSPFSTTR